MAKMVRLSDIAEKLHVSTVTVSKALSGQKGVSDELREKIKQVADELGYVRNESGDKKKVQKSYTVGVIVAERYLQENQSFYWQLYQGVARRTIARNSFSMLEVISYETEKKNEFPKIVTEKKVDGLILMGAFKSEYVAALENGLELPYIFLDTTGGQNGDAVVSNNMMGGYFMTNYLLKMGHRKIGFVGTRLATTSIDDRYLGYLKALMEHGIDWRQDWVIDDRDREFGKVDPDGQLQLPKDMPTAFFCNCDMSASLLIRKLESKGYRVPEDISVVGFDNYISEQFSDIGLTTYEINTREMAKRAVHMLLSKLDNPDYEAGTLILAGNFIERESAKRVGEPVPFA